MACVTTRSPNASTLPATWFSKWRKRFFEQRLAGLEELPRSRSARPPPPDLVVEVKAIACQLELGLPLPGARWPTSAARSCVATWWPRSQAPRSGAGCTRMLSAHGPFGVGSSLATLASRPRLGKVLNLYARKFEGRSLGPREFVISADEETSIQARRRCYPNLPPAPRRAPRVEHEYECCRSAKPFE